MFLCLFGEFICLLGVRFLELWIPKEGRVFFGSFFCVEQTDRQGQLTSRMTNDVAAVVQPVRQIMCLACSSAGASATTRPLKSPWRNDFEDDFP